MHLVYIDETGNTGKNLNDPQQPIFLLCAMLIHKDNWQNLEKMLQSICDEHLGEKAKRDGFEIHATEIRNGKGVFKGMPVADRIAPNAIVHCAMAGGCQARNEPGNGLG